MATCRFAREDADVGVVEIDAGTAASTAGAVRGLGRRAVVAVADVSDAAGVRRAVGVIAAQLGRLDVLVNNAGIERRAAFLDLAPQDWQRQLAVNLSGTFHCTQAAAREMAQRSYVRIVNLASVAGLIGPIDLAAYGAAKAGIIGLTGPPRSGSVPRSS